MTLVASCSSDGEAAPSASTVPPPTTAEVTSTSVDPITIDSVNDTTRSEITATLQDAFDAVQGLPVAIDIELVEDENPQAALVRVDQSAGMLEGEWQAPTSSGSTITTRNVVVDERAFLKSTTGPEAEAALDYTEVSFDRVGVELLDEVFTAYGRLGPSLDRWVVLLEEVPFAAQTSDLDGGVEISIVMSPFAIYDFYAETGLEAVGGSVPEQPTEIAFRIEDGVLTGVVAGGTHFHDGEALDVSAAIVYSPIDPFVLEIPPIES